MSRANQWFVNGDGIAREVITADIQRYLGPDALVRPGVGTGEYQGQAGYWITAYRTLTSPMIQDLRSDSQRWQQERQPGDAAGRGVAYQDSRTHAARQHWGPTKPYEHATEASSSYESVPRGSAASRATYAASSASGYAPSEGSHYTTSSSMSPYGSSHPGYQPSPAAATPRNPPADPYSSSYQQAPSREYSQQAGYGSYTAQPTADPYRQAAPSTSYAAPTSQYATSGQYATPSASAAAPGYYIASDGRQYPLSQQPQPSRGTRR